MREMVLRKCDTLSRAYVLTIEEFPWVYRVFRREKDHMALQLSAKRLREAQQTAQERLDALGGTIPPGLLCGKPRYGSGLPCSRSAGAETVHLGVGPCKYHGGTTTFENTVAALMRGHGLAKTLHVTPWEALLSEVRRSAGEISWLDWKVSQAEHDEDLVGEGEFVPWVKMRNERRTHLARVSKMAMDACVDQQMVAQMQIEGDTIARVLLATLEKLGLDEVAYDNARKILRSELLAIESIAQGMSEESVTLDGDIVSES